MAPFGVYEDRGARVGASLREWGEAVFSSVFGSGPARDAYLRMRARGGVEVVFRSASPSLLGLPWELMRDPGADRPLALEAAGVGRSLPMRTGRPATVAVPGGRLRVLMVISPAGRGGGRGVPDDRPAAAGAAGGGPRCSGPGGAAPADAGRAAGRAGGRQPRPGCRTRWCISTGTA